MLADRSRSSSAVDESMVSRSVSLRFLVLVGRSVEEFSSERVADDGFAALGLPLAVLMER